MDGPLRMPNTETAVFDDATVDRLRNAVTGTAPDKFEVIEEIVGPFLRNFHGHSAWAIALKDWLETQGCHNGNLPRIWNDLVTIRNSEFARIDAVRNSAPATKAKIDSLIHFARLMWSKEVIQFYGWDNLGLQRSRSVRKCAEMWPDFKNGFVPIANAILLEKQQWAMGKGLNDHSDRTTDFVSKKVGDLSRKDWDALEQIARIGRAIHYKKDFNFNSGVAYKDEVRKSATESGHALDPRIGDLKTRSWLLLGMDKYGLLYHTPHRPSTNPPPEQPPSPLQDLPETPAGPPACPESVSANANTMHLDQLSDDPLSGPVNQTRASDSTMVDWLLPDLQPTTFFVRSADDNGTDGDYEYCMSDFLAYMAQEYRTFPRPVVVTDNNFSDGVYDVGRVVRHLNAGLDDAEIEVWNNENETTRNIRVDEFAHVWESNGEPLVTVDLPPEFRTVKPKLAYMERFQLMEHAVTRARRGSGGPASNRRPDDHRCLSFNYVATAGSFLPPRVEGLGYIQLRVLVGHLTVKFVPEEAMEGSWAALDKDGRHWRPDGRQRTLDVNQNEVLLLPPRCVHTFYAPVGTAIVGELLLDNYDLPKSLKVFGRWVKEHPNRLTMGHTGRRLSRVFQGLSRAVDHIPRFPGGHSIADLQLTLDGIVKLYASNESACSTRGRKRRQKSCSFCSKRPNRNMTPRKR